MSSLYYCVNSEVGKGIEPYPTDGHQRYYASLDLSNDIQTHGASTISDPVMPVRNERFAIPFSFSTYIISNLAAKVKGLLIFFNNNCHPPSLLVLLLTEVFNPRPCCFFTLESLLEGGLSVVASPLELLKQPLCYYLIL